MPDDNAIIRREQAQPAWTKPLIWLLNAWFFVYDVITYVPITFLVQPRQRVARSERTKAIRVDGDSNVWRSAAEDQRDSLVGDIYRGHVQRLDAMWRKAVMVYGQRDCMGTREILQVTQEEQKDGRKFEKLTLGEYHWRTFSQVNERVDAIAAGLDACGHRPGAKLCIYAETREEWTTTLIACLSHNAPVVTVYATLGEEAIKHALQQTDSTTLVTTHELLGTVAKIAAACDTLERVVFFESRHPEAGAPKTNAFKGNVDVMSLAQLMAKGESHTYTRPTNTKKDDLAVIMYTSGTTGEPKGVMLTHENIIAGTSGQAAQVPRLGEVDDETFAAFLPLAHVLEIDCEMVVLLHGVRVGYTSALTMTDRSSKIAKGTKGDLSVMQPTLLPAVPAIMDRIYKSVTSEMAAAGPLMAAIIETCLQRRIRRRDSGYDDPFLNRLVFGRIRRLMGGKVRAMLSGGAPLNENTQRFISVCFCCPVLQGYGLTETCGAATLADSEDLKCGHVGPPLVCNRIMLREWSDGGYSPQDDPPAGEVLLSGGNVSIGYWKNEKKTNEEFITIDGQRYFCTGDIGEFTDDGNLKIVDRKKDLVKLSHGEYLSLAKIETALGAHAVVENICVYADSMQDNALALVVPQEKKLKEIAANANITESDWTKLCANNELAKLVCKQLHEQGKRAGLSKIELPSHVLLCAEPWTPGGLLTEAMKLKRRPIAEHYKKQIEKAYGNSIDV